VHAIARHHNAILKLSDNAPGLRVDVHFAHPPEKE